MLRKKKVREKKEKDKELQTLKQSSNVPTKSENQLNVILTGKANSIIENC